jgi:hypothetical protein
VTYYYNLHVENAGLKIRRRSFQTELAGALRAYFGTRKIERQTLYSDRQHGISGAYPRFLAGGHAAIAVDPEETSAVINGIMRAALLWAPLVRRPMAVIVPRGRQQTLAARLRVMHQVRKTMDWLQWDGESLRTMEDDGACPETRVRQFVPRNDGNGHRPHDTDNGDHADNAGHAYRERWLQSKLVGAIRHVIPSIDIRHIYPQVPSFVGGERNIIDLLSVTEDGRLVVIEIKASPDPDLPFQALDYWIAVERHRKAGDFLPKGYFAGLTLKDEPTLLVLLAPLLEYHKTASRLIAMLPREVPLMEIGINQSWKQEIKVLRRKGMLS